MQLRNCRWPERFSIEFDEETFLLRVSDVWHEMGRKIIPGQIEGLIRANDGEMKRRDVLSHFSRLEISPITSKKANDEAVSQGLVERVQLFGRGAPVLLKIRGTGRKEGALVQ